MKARYIDTLGSAFGAAAASAAYSAEQLPVDAIVQLHNDSNWRGRRSKGVENDADTSIRRGLVSHIMSQRSRDLTEAAGAAPAGSPTRPSRARTVSTSCRMSDDLTGKSCRWNRCNTH